MSPIDASKLEEAEAATAQALLATEHPTVQDDATEATVSNDHGTAVPSKRIVNTADDADGEYELDGEDVASQSVSIGNASGSGPSGHDVEARNESQSSI